MYFVSAWKEDKGDAFQVRYGTPVKPVKPYSRDLKLISTKYGQQRDLSCVR